MTQPIIIQADWPAPPNLHALTTTRFGGVSNAHYQSFNLAHHVGDAPTAVIQNRALLMLNQHLPASPAWLNQQHTANVVMAEHVDATTIADASYTRQSHLPCVVLTADCLPILIGNTLGTEIAAIHAGWRGLQQHIITRTLQQLHTSPTHLIAWLGPAISAAHYMVSADLRNQFIAQDPQLASAFTPHQQQWKANLVMIATHQLKQSGVHRIYGGHHCTYQDSQFYSYRRDQGTTGRIASIIWLQ